MYNNELANERELFVASTIATHIDNSTSDIFVLTGSHAIEALTGKNLKHNDVDVNVFTDNISDSITRAESFFEHRANFIKRACFRNNRIDYVYQENCTESIFEIQFVEYSNVHEGDNGEIEYILQDEDSERVFCIPVITKPVTVNSETQEVYNFNIKSLHFAIATWALRISEIAIDQKRNVRQSDYENFMHLIKTPYNNELLRASIANHPQAPNDVIPEDVIYDALTKTQRQKI